MRNISELDKAFDEYIIRLKKEVTRAQTYATENMYQETMERIEIPEEARNINQFIRYAQSIKVKEPKEDRNEIKSSVYSDLVVGGESKWADVPIGAFLEWGTGPLGEDSNTYRHGYPYTTQAPWDEHTAIQWSEIGTWGIAARPHMYPSLISTKPIFISNIKEAIETAWKK